MSEIYESKERPAPYPTAWAVRCPCCETEMEFEAEEDASGAFGFDAANIPICEPCSVMFFPETVQVSVVADPTPQEHVAGHTIMFALDEIIQFLESATRNWSHVPPLTHGDLEDVAAALEHLILKHLPPPAHVSKGGQ